MSVPSEPVPADPSPQPSSEKCPRCHQPCGPLTLLTSMTRYYRCAGCGISWQVRRADDAPGEGPGGS